MFFDIEHFLTILRQLKSSENANTFSCIKMAICHPHGHMAIHHFLSVGAGQENHNYVCLKLAKTLVFGLPPHCAESKTEASECALHGVPTTRPITDFNSQTVPGSRICMSTLTRLILLLSWVHLVHTGAPLQHHGSEQLAGIPGCLHQIHGYRVS